MNAYIMNTCHNVKIIAYIYLKKVGLLRIKYAWIVIFLGTNLRKKLYSAVLLMSCQGFSV